MSFAEKVKKARLSIPISQQAMAAELGISFTAYNRLENGKTEPNYKTQRMFKDFCARHRMHFEQGG